MSVMEGLPASKISDELLLFPYGRGGRLWTNPRERVGRGAIAGRHALTVHLIWQIASAFK